RFDDRGIVYIRYGEPDDTVSTVTYNIQPNETWRYRRADGDLLLHFAANAGGDIHDLRLIPSVMDIGGVRGLGDDRVLPFVLKDRCRLFEPYCKLQAWGHYGQIRLLNREAEVVTASTYVAVTSDGDDPRFSHPLDASAALFAVGQAKGLPLVHLAFEIRVRVPDSVAWGTRLVVPVGVRLDLFDRAGRSGGWLDTTAVLTLPASGPGITSGMGRVVLSVPPGNWRYRAALRYGDSTGLVLRTDSVSIEPFDGSRLVLSDLVLAPVRRGALWIPAPGDSAWFSPQSSWSRQDTIAVYHELYGLAPGDPYRAKLAVRRGRHTVLALGWEGRASGPVTRVTRTLSVESLDPGDYLMELTITDQAHRVTRRSRQFSVR
ncbi:MAG TPA: hypothetical protein VNH46_03375, partial [Gemmatimonadales bacterium]|nr:hypothetical protein [Gemmatimonadales bacterium]